MKRLFLSDLHLLCEDTGAFLRFKECLQQEARRVDEIYILGDLVEMWIGDDDDSKIAAALKQVLRSTTADCPVFIMHGNRDFLFGEAFTGATGVTMLADPFLTTDGILLCHGDTLCTDDLSYQRLRQTLRDPQWQAEILQKTLNERKVFGAGLRAQSRSSNANKPTNIMDVNAKATQALMSHYGAHTLIHGHTHRPGRHEHDNFLRLVMGAWMHCGWLCRQNGSSFSLECFSLARRYEI